MLRRMGGNEAREKRPAARCVLLLLLLLLWGAAAPAPPLEGDPTGQDSVHVQEAAEVTGNGLLTFLARWHEWTSRASAGALVRREASEESKRQDGPPGQQPPRQDKAPCKNFFWKTFSSCK